MRDRCIRVAFHEKILKKAKEYEDTVVIDELGLMNGSVRADIAVLNGKMIGYEIKTDNDNLSRLAGQIIAYNDVFDKVWVITGGKHFDKIKQTVPEWWGIYLISETRDGGYRFRAFRTAKKNKGRSGYSIARLLWKDEARSILADNKLGLKSNTTRHELYNILSKQYSVNTLSKIALKYLKNREGWRTGQKAPS